MLYATLKAVHLLSLMVWVGGMFFTLWCLRPALAVIDAAARPRLMAAALARFLGVVGIAIGLMIATGGLMLWSAVRVAHAPGLAFNMPLDWLAMIVLGVVMMALYGHIRATLLPRLQRAVQAEDAAAAGALLARVRRWVGVNLALGVIVVVIMRLGAAA